MYVLTKIADFFKSNWNDYKYHSLMMDVYFSKPKKWEQTLGICTIALFFISFYYDLKVLHIFAFTFLTIIMVSQAIRSVKESKNCYNKYIKPNILKGEKPFYIIYRSSGTLTAVALKYGKSAIKICAGCFSLGMSGVVIFDYSFGFNPLREYVLLQTGAQTKEQAWNHILNPYKYSNLDHPPYVEDLKQEAIKKNLLIKELQKQLEEVSRK